MPHRKSTKTGDELGINFNIITEVPSSNRCVETVACFLTSSALKEISRGIGGFLLLNSSIAQMTCFNEDGHTSFFHMIKMDKNKG